mgnify:FL=1
MITQNWIELQELVRLLYLSERTIYKHKKNQVFVAGEHFYRVGEGKQKGKCIYGLEECRQALLKHSLEDKKIKGARYKKEMIKDLVAKEVK